ncbi:hypothetical protein NQ176_g9724 [Zarea fungicola]|uniref:Uncharacterized protein n=1 Tax=Zarea fungicola TaxID=93591 RepID=A0ACC1MKY4_9HYPO|nr:hypothetical protein NQ176_g9724 [Lecanicillium fungicola]
MGRPSPVTSPITGTDTRLRVYPQVRVTTNYASSETTLAESLPPSPNQPPPYGDEALPSPPQYLEEGRGQEKKHGPPLPKKTLIIRLCTSIFIAFIVCLIVAAVVGRIHDAQIKKHQEAEDEAARSAIVNGTRITMRVMEMTARSTPTSLPASMVINQSASANPSIARPTGTIVSTYNCPFITPSATRTLPVSTNTGSAYPAGSVCGLTTPFEKPEDEKENGGIVDVALYSLKDCVIARSSYKISGDTLGYRCALSCSEDGEPGIAGLDEGWKWSCG